MNLRHKNLLLAFTSMLVLTLFSLEVSPLFHLIFFAPFLILVYYQKSFSSALMFSFSCGLITDLFTSPLRFGLHALNYTLTTAFIYHQRRNLFADNLFTLPIMTFLFSALSTFLQLILLYLFAKPVTLSFYLLISDFLIMPFIDALFSFCWFIFSGFIFSEFIFGKKFWLKPHSES